MQCAPDAPFLPDTTFKFIWHCWSRFKGWLVLMLLLEVGQALGNILVPYAIKAIMDGVAHFSDGDVFAALREPLLFLLALNVLETLSSRGSGAVLIIMGTRLRQRTSQQLYAYLQYHSPRYFSTHFAGGLAHRISETAMSVNHTTWTILCDFWPVVVMFSVSSALLLNVHQGLGGFVTSWVLFYVCFSYWLATRCQPYAERYAAMRSLVNGKIVDAVTNVLNAKLFARLAFEREFLDRFLSQEAQTARDTFWYMERVRWFQFTAAAVLKIGSVCYALSLWQSGVITVGEFTMSIGLALLIISSAQNLTRRFLEFFEYIGNVANGVSTIIKAHEIIDCDNAKPLHVTRGRIEFKNVGFAYNAAMPVFENLNVAIEPGRRAYRYT